MTNQTCVTYSLVLIISGLFFILLGTLFWNSERRVVNVNQTLFFWIGRDRIVLDKRLTFIAVGGVLLGLGALGLYAGLTVEEPY